MNKKTKKIFLSNYFFIIIFILIFAFIFALIEKYNDNKKIESDLDSLKKEIENLEKNNNELSNLIGYFNSNFFVEKEAREKMGLKKEGETVLVFDDQGNIKNQIEGSQDANNQKDKSFYLLWWEYFFK